MNDNDQYLNSKRGGIRQGAGRRNGTGKFREPTTVLRVPASQTTVIKDFLIAYQRKKLTVDIDAVIDFEWPKLNTPPINLLLYSSKVSAGFPSPAEEHVEKRLNPNDFLIDQMDATFFVTIQGYSMMDVGLLPNDKAVVDRSKQASIGDIVLAVIDGEFTIKTLSRNKDGSPKLLPANSTGAYSPIEIKEGMNFEIWGVVTGSFRRFK
ncbi:MAG: translesion error-prone DNA polymerase V autoproteolytic subunit [Methylotenera sp.]|uniref:LexA family protein n=1 Tax=Methylotenera sp. TaxID=2051956 RepID=UPI001809CDB9|nr:translesion error-prone DNA polymerase V autoproteolytic subunit [Methylotenera sp.]NOU24099.1 translesion error-prone DNA polymerase V autoproteolytic subunit [Methylotenera sp.]